MIIKAKMAIEHGADISRLMHGYNNLLLTEREVSTGEYWLEVVAVQNQPRANIPRYGPEQEVG